jgi:beta-1,4-N-acetylglucosaminyltransferase
MKSTRILFVCSAGGHLSEILELNTLFQNNSYILITEYNESYKDLAKKMNIKFVLPAGKGRDFIYWRNFILNFIFALYHIIKFKPNFIISTGSHTAIPYFVFSKLFKCKSIFILSFALINTTSKSANFIYKLADEFIVQWESAKKNYPKAKFLGGSLF